MVNAVVHQKQFLIVLNNYLNNYMNVLRLAQVFDPVNGLEFELLLTILNDLYKKRNRR
jgi:hypothetical protein